MIDWASGWLMEWLIEWLSDWWSDWLIDWMNDWLSNWLIDGVIEWLIDWLIPVCQRQTFEVLCVLVHCCKSASLVQYTCHFQHDFSATKMIKNKKKLNGKVAIFIRNLLLIQLWKCCYEAGVEQGDFVLNELLQYGKCASISFIFG